jgi:hypothetical protein
MAVLATGATTARSLAARLGDVYSVEDFGVVHDPAGVYAVSNTAAYQAALNAAAGVATLRHRKGLTVYHAGLTVPSGTVLQLDGYMGLATNATQGQVLIVGSNYAIFSPGRTGIIDQQNVNPTQYGGAGIWSPNDYAGGSPTTGNPAQTTGLIDGLEIKNCKNWPVCIANSAYVVVQNCYMHDCGNSPQFVGGCSYSLFFNNRFANIPDYCPAFYQGGSYLKMIGNTTNNCATAGALNDGATAMNFSFLEISENTFVNSTAQAITLNAPAGGTVSNVQVLQNRIINASLITGNTGTAIYVGSGNFVRIERNIITGGGSGATGENAIGLNYAAGQSNVFITENIIDNWNSTGKGSGATGIYVTGSSIANLVVSKNKIQDLQATPTIQNGIVISVVGNGLIVDQNEISSNVTSQYNITSQADTFFNKYTSYGQQVNSTILHSSRQVTVGFDYVGGAGTVNISGNYNVVLIQNSGLTVSSIALSFPALPSALQLFPIKIVTDSPVTSLTWSFPSGTSNFGASLPSSLAAGDQIEVYWCGLINQWIKVAAA